MCVHWWFDWLLWNNLIFITAYQRLDQPMNTNSLKKFFFFHYNLLKRNLLIIEIDVYKLMKNLVLWWCFENIIHLWKMIKSSCLSVFFFWISKSLTVFHWFFFWSRKNEQIESTIRKKGFFSSFLLCVDWKIIVNDLIELFYGSSLKEKGKNFLIDLLWK